MMSAAPECGSNRMPKDGTSKGRQVYHCGDCGRRTIPDTAYQRPSAADKERGLAMYREGSSLSAIARIGVSVPAVIKWVKWGQPHGLGRAAGAQSALPAW